MPARNFILTARLEAFIVCEMCSLIFQLLGTTWRLEGGALPCFLADQVREAGDLAQPANLILQIVSEAPPSLRQVFFKNCR